MPGRGTPDAPLAPRSPPPPARNSRYTWAVRVGRQICEVTPLSTPLTTRSGIDFLSRGGGRVGCLGWPRVKFGAARHPDAPLAPAHHPCLLVMYGTRGLFGSGGRFAVDGPPSRTLSQIPVAPRCTSSPRSARSPARNVRYTWAVRVGRQICGRWTPPLGPSRRSPWHPDAPLAPAQHARLLVMYGTRGVRGSGGNFAGMATPS